MNIEEMLTEENEGRLYEEFLVRHEPGFLKEVLVKTNGNQSKAAKALGISRSTLRKKMNQYHLITKRSK